MGLNHPEWTGCLPYGTDCGTAYAFHTVPAMVPAAFYTVPAMVPAAFHGCLRYRLPTVPAAFHTVPAAVPPMPSIRYRLWYRLPSVPAAVPPMPSIRYRLPFIRYRLWYRLPSIRYRLPFIRYRLPYGTCYGTASLVDAGGSMGSTEPPFCVRAYPRGRK